MGLTPRSLRPASPARQVSAALLLVRPGPSFAWLVGAYAFAWLLGFIVPLLPGGLGLRDATLAAFLAQPLGAGAGTALSLAMRLANTLGEFAAIGLVEAGYKLASAGRPAGQRLATRVQPAVDRARLVIEELR